MSQTVSINFSQGLNTKTDEWQLPVGSFLRFENAVFQKGGLLQKRNGYGSIASTTPVSSYLTTLNGNLVSIGNTVNAFSSSLNEWIKKGNLSPCELSTLPLIRNNLNQVQVDAAISNGLVMTTYTSINNTNANTVTQYLYAILDETTGQNIAPPTAIPVLTNGTIVGSPRAFVIEGYFLVVSPVMISGGGTFLQYFTVPVNNPVNTATNVPNASAAQNVTSDAYVIVPTGSANPGWDGVVVGTNFVVAYNTTTGAQGVHVALLTLSQIAALQQTSTIQAFAGAAFIAAILSICADVSVNPNVFYVSFWNNATSNGYTLAVTIGLNSIATKFTPVQIISSVAVVNLASAAQNGSALVFSEVGNTYSYDATTPTDFINAVTVSAAGTVGTPYVSARSIGLASKAFIINATIYYLAAHQSPLQPTYFMMNGTLSTSAAPIVVAKLAYENGNGYDTRGLQAVSISGDTASIPYLIKDSLDTINPAISLTTNNTQDLQNPVFYSQTGINLASFTFSTTNISTAEIGGVLNISGGFLGMYDGYLPVENNFFIFPEDVKATYTAVSTVTPTGNTTSGSAVILALSSVTGISPGMSVSGTGIPANSFVVFISGSSITLNNTATATNTGTTLTIQGNVAAVPTGGGAAGLGLYYYQVTYEWTDNLGIAHKSTPSVPVTAATSGSAATGVFTLNIPTLRLTYKILSPVKIVVYRWSVNTQVYNEVTSIVAPLLNNTTVDSVSFVDTLPDSSVVGNDILYTTGGVVADINGPASNIMCLFDTRLVQVSAEDDDVLNFSKQVIENTPVEMNTAFTIYVSPNTGTESSTGGMTAIAPMDDKLIIFKNDAIYYINGVGPNNLGTTSTGCSLGNYSQPTFITSVVGCSNQQSIVLTSAGLMFQSDKGIWLLSRNLSTSYIGAPVERYNSLSINSANVIPAKNYVLFTLSSGEMLMYDYYYSQWGTFKGASAISSCIYNGMHTLLTPYGQILQETEGEYLDNGNPVLISFATGWLNIASLQGYQRFYRMYFLARYLGPHFLNVDVAYDYNASVVHNTIISPTNYGSVAPSAFGEPVPFGSPADIEQWRIDAKLQLCQSFQISLSEIFNPAFGTVNPAGFTMSGITCEIEVKKATRPIRGANTSGFNRG